mmetsp:Transcript_42400/g.106378  ORF Transcript_42400/g.106378 Transcript_42400/m.106378 type:complete len:281 (+) Transcript_42400:253-1095(+)
MSPACCAPASATAPATRLATTLPGASVANTICDSFPTPLTGLRSVSPSARMASTATSIATATATSGCHSGSANMGPSTAQHSTVLAARPHIHQAAGIGLHLPSLGVELVPASARGAYLSEPPPARCRTQATAYEPASSNRLVRLSPSMTARLTQSTHPLAPVCQSVMGPGAQPAARTTGPSHAYPTSAPASIDSVVRGPMIMPCPTYPNAGTISQPQAAAACTPSQSNTGKWPSEGTRLLRTVSAIATPMLHSSMAQVRGHCAELLASLSSASWGRPEWH